MRPIALLALVPVLAACQATTPAKEPGVSQLDNRRTSIAALCNGAVQKKNYGTHAAQAMIADGWRQMERGAPDVALDRFAGSVILGKERPDAYWGMAVAGHKANYPDTLIRSCFTRAETMFGEPPAVLYADWGMVLEQRGQAEAALPLLRKALAREPAHLSANVTIARAYLALGREADAAPHIALVKKAREGG